MSPFFFHLKLELYASPAAEPSRQRTPSSTPPKVFVPSCDTNIFQSTLPTHRTLNFTQSSTSRSSSTARTPPRHDPKRDAGSKALLLPERSGNLKDITPRTPSLVSTVKPSNEISAQDWRYDRVSIESIDMESVSRGNTSQSQSASKSSVAGLHTKGTYVPGTVKATDVGWGIVHLYRDVQESRHFDAEAQSKRSLGHSREDSGDFKIEECTTLCILAVPSWMMPSDLLGFVGDQAREDVSHFRLIRTGRANKYMVLMKFRSPKRARDWQKMYNGRLFSAAEPENCHVVFIKSVQFLSPDSDITDASSFPRNTNDPFTLAASSNSMSSKPFAPPPPNLLELPTCPVCLERMDETTGLLTILCQHVFHCACLEKWRGSGCPVCRYTHSPSFTFPFPRPDASQDDSEPVCSVCASTANLWICLICGSIGCGRYDSAHAYAHYEATSHCYAMDINTQHVWDYAGDGYVHRLIQSKPDSRPSDLSSGQQTRHENEAFRAEGGDSVPREKMESMAAEYTYLLTSQLEGQRRYFEEQVERAVDKASKASTRADEAAAQASEATSRLQCADDELKRLTASLAQIQTSLEKAERARHRFEQMARDMSAKLREEKVMNEGLSSRITAAEEHAAKAKEEVDLVSAQKAELEEMNRDLTMFISGQEKVKELQAQGEEVVDGQIILPPEQPKKKGKGRKR